MPALLPRLGGALARTARLLRRALAALARAVSDADEGGRGRVALQAYRGYGSREEVFLLGRVFLQPAGPRDGEAHPLRHDLVNVARRLLRRGAPGAELVARFPGTEPRRVVTDRDGYLRVHLRLERPPPADRLWHPLLLELEHPGRLVARGEVFVPPPACRFVVVSDIDDTVVHTGAANKLKMLWRFAARGGATPTPIPGIASLYRALHRGASGEEANPLLYVSRGPWAIYELLDEFFNANRIPVGPILFLREWGVSWRRPFPRRARDHKLALIRNMLALYRDLPFLLVGDSAEADPEIYASVVHENPGRVLAVYIRDATRDPFRSNAIQALAREVEAAGSSLVLAEDAAAMAAHAASLGLIAPDPEAATAAAAASPDDRAAAEPALGDARASP